jgi:hypothetical protein
MQSLEKLHYCNYTQQSHNERHNSTYEILEFRVELGLLVVVALLLVAGPLPRSAPLLHTYSEHFSKCCCLRVLTHGMLDTID